MKTIVTVSNLKEGATTYKQVVVNTTLFGADGGIMGLASISFTEFGGFLFKVQLRYVSHTLNTWTDVYNTLDFGANRAKEIFQKVIVPLIGKVGDEDTYHVINNVCDDDWDGKKEGWNQVLDEVDRFIQAIDLEYRLFPELDVDGIEENP